MTENYNLVNDLVCTHFPTLEKVELIDPKVSTIFKESHAEY